MSKIFLPALAVLTLGGCSEPASRGTPAPADSNVATKAAEAGTTLSQSSAEPRFVGLWAADKAMCGDKGWRFTETALRTPAGSACDFEQVTPVGGGYDIAATCTAEGPETADTLKIRFAESAKAMLFESDSIADAGLIYCGPAE